MLAYILAVLVGTGSVGLYISAFFFPEIHRKQDFIWSGVGFFYALVLWIYARQETGGILLGQTASVSLLGWFAWQTLKLRRQLVPVNQQTPIPSTTQIKEQLGLKQPAPTTVKTPTKKVPSIRPTESQEAATVARNVDQPVPPILPPASFDFAPEDEAWIKLEVKPAPDSTKFLGTPVKTPTSPRSTTSHAETIPSPAIIPETISTDLPTDPIQTKAQLNPEDPK